MTLVSRCRRLDIKTNLVKKHALQSKHKQTMEVYNYQYYVTYFVILNSITAHNFDKKDVLEEIFGSGQSSNDNPVRIFYHYCPVHLIFSSFGFW